ncbi:MAG TPA: transketolase [Thermomicrobiales bacterium]|nr:transketolase [Thermomicrobiales bacterium]
MARPLVSGESRCTEKRNRTMTAVSTNLTALAQQLRVDSVRNSTAAGSGHPSSALSAADLMAVLITRFWHYDFDRPENPGSDHLIFSKGHASSLLYAMYKAAGAISDEQMMTYRRMGSPFQGHPTPALPWVDVATGSLGQGLPIAVGVAIAGKYLDKLPYRVWVLCGDSEFAEGSIAESMDKANYYKLGNLVAILDMNRLGQRGQTEYGWDGDEYAARARAFGWHPIEVDGHDFDDIERGYQLAIQHQDHYEQPVLIVARTVKGKGISWMENQNGWHGKPVPKDKLDATIAELGGATNLTFEIPEAPAATAYVAAAADHPAPTTYELGSAVATRKAYGDGLKAVGALRPDVVVLDAEVSNSTMAEIFKEAYPDRFFEMFIAEQQMVAAAVGIGVRGYVPFASTFGAFMSRAYDFIRMAAISQANIKLCGSHAGVSIGEDGPSQMALEDIAMMRAVHGSVVLYPSDANQTVALVHEMADHDGIAYMRTTRAATPVIYEAGDVFKIGGSKVARQSDSDEVTIVAAGITLHEALKAADQLAEQGIHIRVIDLYSVKPVDYETVREALVATHGRLVVVEDHWPQGGLASAILECLATRPGSTNGFGDNFRMTHLAPSEMPGSGTPDELMDWAGISARHIIEAVCTMLD